METACDESTIQALENAANSANAQLALYQQDVNQKKQALDAIVTQGISQGCNFDLSTQTKTFEESHNNTEASNSPENSGEQTDTSSPQSESTTS